MNGHAHMGTLADLRSPERLARLELDRVTALTLDGLAARTLLDIGTGSGLGAEAFAARGLRVSGIDASAEMLAAARGYVPLGAFARSCLERLPFRDAAFDLAFFGHVLHETDEMLQALREARRVVTKRVAVLEWPYAEPGSDGHGPPLSRRIASEALLAAARAAGFSNVRAVPLTHMAYYRLDV